MRPWRDTMSQETCLPWGFEPDSIAATPSLKDPVTLLMPCTVTGHLQESSQEPFVDILMVNP